MNNAMFKGILLASLGIAVAACSDSEGLGNDNAFGKISPVAELNSSVASSRPSRLEYTDISVDDLSIRLTSDDGSYSKTWDKIADFPLDQEFNVGDYTLEVFYGDENTEGFEYPRFYGKQAVKVRENQTTPATVTATVDNALVSIDYSDNFKDYMTSWSAELHAPGGAYVDYASDETRPAYVKPGEVEIYVDYVKPNGKGAKIKAASFEAKAATHYFVSMDLTTGAGDATLTITFDETTDEEPVSIELSDDLESSPAPEISLEGISAAEPIYIVPGFVSDTNIKLNIIARGSLDAVKMTTQSTSLTAQGWPSEIDLLSATSAQQSTLTSLGFVSRGLFSNPDKMAVIELGNVLKHITTNNNNNTTTFAFLVEDKQGKVSDAVSFSIIAEELSLALSNPSELYQGDDEISLDVNFNAGNLEDNLQIQYLNSRGSWTKAEATYTLVERGLYRADVKVPAGSEDVTLRAVAGSKASDELNVSRIEIAISAEAPSSEVYATSATIDCSLLSLSRTSQSQMLENLLNTATVMVSTDGTNYSAATTTHPAGTTLLTVSGLTPATSYTAKIKFGTSDYTDSQAISFSTEGNAQLPNGDMEADVTTASSDKYWTCYTFADGWGSNNPMTTSQGANYAYCRISGTIPTTDAHNGKAMLIRTVGWGSGNTASGYASTGVCKYREAGLLHLGSDRTTRPDGYGENDHNSGCGPLTTDDLDCGIDFTSRPSAMKFWYKYTAKNSSDAGQAEIRILDASGDVIASGTASLGAASSYTQRTINLSYKSGSAKAAKIYVKFLSTADEQFLIKSNDNLSAPKFGNMSDGTYLGSQLYIDDIELIY